MSWTSPLCYPKGWPMSKLNKTLGLSNPNKVTLGKKKKKKKKSFKDNKSRPHIWRFFFFGLSNSPKAIPLFSFIFFFILFIFWKSHSRSSPSFSSTTQKPFVFIFLVPYTSIQFTICGPQSTSDN
jgi:hypothetical protein